VTDDEKLSGFPLTVNFVLDGVIQGHSGKWAESWRNTRLAARDPEQKDLTAEGALGRCAMRVMPTGKFVANISNWPIYYTEIAAHKQQSKDTWWGWGRTKFVNDKPVNGPKYGPMFVTDQVRIVYKYNQQFPSAINGAQQFHYYPTVKLVSRDDVLEYDDVASRAITDKSPLPTFVEFIQKRHQAGKAQIYQVWVRNADFSGLKLQAGIYNDVDFSGCCFDKTTMTNLICNRTNFSFVQGHGIVCQNVSFDQANFNFAVLSNAEFDDNVSYIGVTWVGTNLSGLTKNKADLAAQLQKVQKDQTESACKINEKILELQESFMDFEAKINAKQEAIESQLKEQISSLDDALRAHAITLITLTEEITQTQLNCQNLKTNLEARIFELNSSLSALSTEQAGFKQTQTLAIESIGKQLRNLQQSNTRFDDLINSLQDDLKKIDTKSAETLGAISTNFTAQHEQLKTELLAAIEPLRDKIDLVDADVQLVKRQLTVASRRKILVNAFINNQIYGKSKVGDISIAEFEINTGGRPLNNDELRLIDKVLENVDKADKELNAFKENLIAKGADSTVGNIVVRTVIAYVAPSEHAISSNQEPLGTASNKSSPSPVLESDKKT
jgi:hypothetical protein